MAAPSYGIAFPPRFSIVRKVGQGAMGQVFEAVDLERNIPVALKALSNMSADFLYLFKQEFRSLTGILHPNLAALYELYAQDGLYFLSMEFIEGVDFLEYVAGGVADGESTHLAFGDSRLSPPGLDADTPGSGVAAIRRAAVAFDEHKLRSTLQQLGEGLSALHAAGKLHRDVKPSNVLVEQNGRVVLVDFGLVVGLNEPQLDHDASVVPAGTMAYMPPEQYWGRATPPSDWYAVGSMLYEVLTGSPPFRGRGSELMQLKETTDPPAPKDVNPKVPDDLNELCLSLLRRDPRERPNAAGFRRILGASATTISPSQAAPTFVGRDAQLTQLHCESDAATREAAVVFISGPSGVGKSALVERCLEQFAQDSTVLVLHGRCYEQEAVPYKAVDSLMDRLSRYLKRLPHDQASRLLPPDAPALAAMFPVLGRVAAIARLRDRESMARDAVELRDRAFRALRALLTGLAETRRLVLAIDDLQWTDTDSAELLIELLRDPAPRLLLLCSFRNEYQATNPGLRTLSEALAASPIRHCQIDLPPLSADESAELAGQVLGSADPATAGRIPTIVRDSGGFPFFIHELAKAGASAPDSPLDFLIWTHVQALPEESRRLLEVVAVAGWPVPQVDAFTAAGIPGRSPRVLNPLCHASLMRSSGPRELDQVETFHDRIREAVLARLPEDRKKSYHQDLAETLESTRHAEPEMLAVHFEACGHTEKAGFYLGQAADQAAGAVAFTRAVHLYERALKLATLTIAERCTMETKLARATANSGRSVDSGHCYLRAAAHASGQEQLLLEGQAASQLCIGGRFDEGLDLMRRVSRRLASPLPTTRIGLLASLAWRDIQFRIQGYRFRTRRESDIDPAALARIDFLWNAALGIGWSGMFAMLEALMRSLILAVRAGEPFRIGRGALFYAVGQIQSGAEKWPQFERGLECSRQLFREAGDPPAATALLSLAQAQAAFVAGRFRQSFEHANAGIAFIPQHCPGMNWEFSTLRLMNLWTLYALGRYRQLKNESEHLLEDAKHRGDLYTFTNVGVCALPLVFVAADKPLEAERVRADSLGRWPHREFSLQHYMANNSALMILLYQGRATEALALAESSWPAVRALLILRHGEMTLLFRDLHARAFLAASVDHPSAEKYLAASANIAAEIRSLRLDHAQPTSDMIDGCISHFCGRHEESRRLLEGAIQAFDEQGLDMQANVCRWRLGQWMGQQGKQLLAIAETYMQREGIVAPERMCRLWLV